MNVEDGFRLTNILESSVVHFVAPRIIHLTLAVLVALVALVGLSNVLSEARLHVQADHSVAVLYPVDGSAHVLYAPTQGVPGRCCRPTLSVAQQVAPAAPDTGSMVNVTFPIAGVGLKQADVVLVYDVSGSMLEGDTPSGQTRLQVAQAAGITFVNQLADTDRVAVVAYSDTARLLLPLTTDTDAAIAALDSLTAHQEWYSNIRDGIAAGYGELISSTRYYSHTVKAIVLLSDGGANRPEPVGVAEQYAIEQAEAAGDCGILVYTIGVGDTTQLNEELLQAIAHTAGGEYYYSPDSVDLGTIYQEIALALRNLVITDLLPPGVDVGCSSISAGTCNRESGLTTTVILSPNNEALMVNPLLSFTATINLDPGYEGPISADGSDVCYDGAGGRTCFRLESPAVAVGGRKITGVVFEDLDCDGLFDGDETALSGVVVTTSNGLTSITDNGIYLFRTSAEPALTVAVQVPPYSILITSEVTRVPSLSGTYQWNFGLCPVLDGISLSELRVEPPVEHHGESTVLYYSVVNHNHDDGVVTGTVVIADSLSRPLDEKHFSMAPGVTTTLQSPSFIVPRDIVITLTATATYAISGGLSVSDQKTLPLCPEDVYEPDGSAGEAYPIHAGESQIHDFFTPGDEDWVGLRLHQGDRSLFVFTALPLGASGLPISLTLYHGGTSVIRSNLDDPRAPVQVGQMLACIGAHVCDYFLQAQSTLSGCWTDYELSVEETPWDELQHVLLPLVLKYHVAADR